MNNVKPHGDSRDSASEVIGRDTFNEPIFRSDLPEKIVGRDTFGEPITNHDLPMKRRGCD